MSARSAAVGFDHGRLRQWREAHRLSQGDVAKALHYDRTSIGKIERGQVRPTLRFIELLHERFPETLRLPLFPRHV